MLRRAARNCCVVAAITLLAGCEVRDVSGCRQSTAIEGAKNLDQPYLSQLYAYAASGQCTSMCRPSILSRLSAAWESSPSFRGPAEQASAHQIECLHGKWRHALFQRRWWAECGPLPDVERGLSEMGRGASLVGQSAKARGLTIRSSGPLRVGTV